jgi:phage-related tail protein
MATLNTKVKKYIEDNSKTWDSEKNNIVLQNDGSEDYIKSWNVSGLSKPTAEQIASYETAGNTVETNNTVIATRKLSYGSWETQLEEIYDDGIDAWKTRIAKVKSDNPKE